MGCCSSQHMDAVTPPEKGRKESFEAPECNAAATDTLSSCQINLEVLLPEGKIFSADDMQETSGHSPSPTGVTQRSKKSVTFNPISTIKEYRRDSSSTDKNFTTYIISQLGEDNWSDDESDGLSEEQDGEERENNDLASEEDNELARLADEASFDEGDEEWRRELDLSRERAIQEGDPGYIEGYDFDYQEHEYGFAGEEQGMYVRCGGIASSYRPESCVWICSN